ncbi:hypothetical protein J4573_44030 [Actinomadura barringtoniae]|uniref:Uncharacterized protein n=1 Tax=Actinomadura barringtoniae TaxID=1427535 RepID=A0A939PJM7_9ACTN|nr:hypothetical protein [Actinomadura barringtoniae]MBO2454122.1 hypothetical protein [Actinomadura barringtoniae]
MNWQAAGAGLGGTGSGPGTGSGTGGGAAGDLFAAVEANVRELVASQWWRAAAPQQRAEQIIARMLWGAGEWWLFGAWGRWYRGGLDGSWHPCPPPTDPGDRRVAVPAPRGAATPPVPPQLFPTGPDLSAGRVSSLGFLGPQPETAVVARISQAITTALAVNPAQFAQQDPTFQPGTPSTIAAAWASLLWCAGSPVALAEHPLIASFVPFLTTPAERLHWMMPPDFATLAGYYTSRLGAGDAGGAAHIARVMYEVAAGLQADPRFRPGADALAAVTAASLRLVPQDMATARYGPAAVLQEWRRRCPAEYATTMVRDAAPGEFLRLALYDLQQIVSGLTGPRPAAVGRGHDEVRRAGVAVLAADLQAAPNALPALQRWLDPDSARTLQAVLADPGNPLRELWPREGRLPEPLAASDPDATAALLATTYTLGLTWCRLAQVPPPAVGFAVPQAAATELAGAGVNTPPSTDELSAWDLIKAAREHLAAQREQGKAAEPPPAIAPEPPPEAPPIPIPSPAEAPPGPPPSAPLGSAGAPPIDPYGSSESEVAAPPPAAQGRDPFAAQGPPPRIAPPPPPPPPMPAADATVDDPHAVPPPAPAWPQADSASAASPAAAPVPLMPEAPEPAWPVDPSATQFDPDPEATQLDPGRPPAAPEPVWPTGPPEPPEPPAAAAAAAQPNLPPPPVPVSEPPPPAPPQPAPETGTQVAEAYGIRFLCGADDIERVVTEVRRRGKWAKGLRGQEVSSASVPALLLIGTPSSGQRRLARMVARALAEVEVSSGEVHSMHSEDLREAGPDGLRAALDEHAGHVLLLEGLETLILDDSQGGAYASAFYRARLEGVSDTALLGTCEPDRVGELSAASPELVADLRAVRLPDLSEMRPRTRLLALLAEERRLRLSQDAWEVVHRELAALRGRGRLTGARLIEAYLDRAASRNLGRAEATHAIGSASALTLMAADFEGVAAELSH